MANAFDSSQYPTTEPGLLVVGDRWAWKRQDLGVDYAPASYTLTYSARLEGTPATEIEITASADGSDYVVEVGADVTAAYTAGDYRWAAYITDSGDSTKRLRVDAGTWELAPDLDEDSTTDPRTHAKKMLDLIEAAIEGRATNTQLDTLSYSLPDRSASRDPSELRRWRNHYVSIVRMEQGRERVLNGGHDGTLVKPVFPA